MPDFPDWQAFPSAQGANLFTAVSQTLPPGTYTSVVMPVTSFSSLSAVINPSSGSGQLLVNHWADSAGTVSADTDTFLFTQGAALVVRTPLRSPYMSLTLKVTSAGNLVATTWATLLASSSARVTFPVPTQQAGDESQTLGGGVQAQWRIPAIVSGPGMLLYFPGDNSGKITVQVVATDELANVLYTVFPTTAPTANLVQPLQIPDKPILIKITNTDTVNHSYGVSLIVPPN